MNLISESLRLLISSLPHLGPLVFPYLMDFLKFSI